MLGNSIHPTAIFEGDVLMGNGDVVGPYCVLTGPLTMGDDNGGSAHTVIGFRGDEFQQRRYDASEKAITIGDLCNIREHVTIHKAC